MHAHTHTHSKTATMRNIAIAAQQTSTGMPVHHKPCAGKSSWGRTKRTVQVSRRDNSNTTNWDKDSWAFASPIYTRYGQLLTKYLKLQLLVATSCIINKALNMSWGYLQNGIYIIVLCILGLGCTEISCYDIYRWNNIFI